MCDVIGMYGILECVTSKECRVVLAQIAKECEVHVFKYRADVKNERQHSSTLNFRH